MALDESKTDEDHVDEAFGVTIVTQKKLSPYLEGAIIDYTESIYGAGFEIKTPNKGDCSSTCGGGCS